MLPDFLTIRRNRRVLRHSAKGSTWEEHKYIKRIDGTYYYPDSYEGGRHLPDGEKSSSDNKQDQEDSKREKLDLSSDDIERLAQEVIRGNFGNGQDRKDLLGENYQEIQDRVNQILRNSGASSQKISSAPPDKIESSLKVIENAIQNIADSIEKKKAGEKKGIDLDSVYNVYKKK